MIDTGILETKFSRIGARLKLTTWPDRPRSTGGGVTLDVRHDREGGFFEIRSPGAERAPANVEVLDVQPGDRHLLVLVREGAAKHKFLCGHDERHWFVAAIPESAPVGTVRAAKEALKPAEVQAVQARKGLRAAARNRRKNAAYRRQGEWFFLPAPGLQVNEAVVLRNERITRGNGSKPHCAEFCYRDGGQTVYVCARHPRGVDVARYQRILESDPQAKTWGWRAMQRNAEVYVRGRIRHADHKTITLPDWHRVLMNTEHQARAMRHVAFLD
jgi:hypothetical protein